MKSVFMQLFEAKGLNIPYEDYKILADRWKTLQLKKQKLDYLDLKESDISLKHIPGR